MENKIKSFIDLTVWKEGHKLVLMVYKETNTFPKEEMYSLIDQLRRAVISITSNIAEGFGRHSYKEKIQFYYMSSGSLSEARNQFIIAKDLGYISQEKYLMLENQAETVSKLLFGIIRSSKERL